MFRNYFIVALRNIARHRLYSFINIAGLMIGLACAILVILFVRDELSFDGWIPDTQDLYRLELTLFPPDRPSLATAVIPYNMPKTMLDEIPGVIGQSVLGVENMSLVTGDKQFIENVDVVDPGFFTLIKLPFIAGDPATVFSQPQSLVLTQSAARKYFGNENPIGRVISTVKSNCADNDLACQHTMIALTVTGVIYDLPHNTQLSGDLFLPNTSIAEVTTKSQKDQWLSQNVYGYVRLAPGLDPQSVIARMGPIFDRYVTPELKKFGMNIQGSKVYSLHMTRFDKVHLDASQWQSNLTPPGSWVTVYGVITIGVLILLVAGFNFMNLSTVRAAMRAREIALRKTMGATRSQLVTQFLGEAVLMALLALVVAISVVEVVLPTFDAFLQRPIAFHYLSDWPLLLGLVGIAIIAGLVSGFYPSLVLSGFRPAITLRDNSAGHTGSGALRNLLVVFQFAVSIGLGIAATIVFAQIQYARNIDLGFHHDNILVINSGRLNIGQRAAFDHALRDYPGIISVGQSDRTPFQIGQSLAVIRVPGQNQDITLNSIGIDPYYPKVYGIEVVAGRDLSDDRADDQMHSNAPQPDPLNSGKNILLNVSGARRLGFAPDQAVGQTVKLNGSDTHIVGVLADAKTAGARAPVTPNFYYYVPDNSRAFSVRLRPDMIRQTLAFIDKTWNDFSPQFAVSHSFLDDDYAKFYATDERQGTMFATFVGVAIFIACLGLFGLAAFTAGQRTLEIGVRKVFGARIVDIVAILLWQFSIPVLIANLIAWPLAWYYLKGWLEGFAYRIDLSPLYFFGAGFIALLIAWATIAGHAISVARGSTVKALRHE